MRKEVSIEKEKKKKKKKKNTSNLWRWAVIILEDRYIYDKRKRIS
jgi:hypothetical protein